MAEGTKRPRIKIIGGNYEDNRRHGLHLGKGADADVQGLNIRRSGGSAIHVEGDSDDADEDGQGEPERAWWERPIGIILLLVIAGLIVAFSAYRFGWV
jgi:hypothetical protein